MASSVLRVSSSSAPAFPGREGSTYPSVPRSGFPHHCAVRSRHALFRRWKDGARKRLDLGTATYVVNRTATSVTITATGTFPAVGCEGWFQPEEETEDAKTYVLCVERPDGPGTGTPEAFALRERYRATDTRSVFVRDATGVQQLV